MWLPMNPEAPVTATMVDANSVESAEDAIVVQVGSVWTMVVLIKRPNLTYPKACLRRWEKTF